MILRVAALGCLLLGVMLGIVASSEIHRSVATAQMPPGVMLETLIESQPFAPPPSPSTMSSFRITYEPGATFDASFSGPLALQVASGKMAIRPDRKTSVGYHYVRDEAGLADGSLNDPKLKDNEQGETILSAGWSVTVDSGQLGLTRNAGTDPLVVYAMLLFPEPLYTGAARHETSKMDGGNRRDREKRRTSETPADATPVQSDPEAVAD